MRMSNMLKGQLCIADLAKRIGRIICLTVQVEGAHFPNKEQMRQCAHRMDFVYMLSVRAGASRSPTPGCPASLLPMHRHRLAPISSLSQRNSSCAKAIVRPSFLVCARFASGNCG